MRRIRRRLMRTYANLDIPIEWKDDELAQWMKTKNVLTRRDCLAYKSYLYGADVAYNGIPYKTVRHFPEMRWFTNARFDLFNILYGWECLEDVRLPETIKVMKSNFCMRDRQLRKIELPMGLGTMQRDCFYGGLDKLELRMLPPGLKAIGAMCFDGCSKITLSRIPDGVTYGKIRAFNYCTSLETMTIPDGMTELEDNFLGSTTLRWVKMLGAVPPKFHAHVLGNPGSIYVPDGSVEAYKAACKEYKDKFRPMSEWVEE